MSATVLIHFTVRARVPKHNVECVTKVLAETDVQAIQLTKDRLEQALDSFIGHQRRQRKEPFAIPKNFWAEAEITAEPSMQPMVLEFAYDRIQSDLSFIGL